RDRDARQGARSLRRLLRDGAGGRALPNASSGPVSSPSLLSRRNRYAVVINRQCGSDSVRAREAPMTVKTLTLALFLTLVLTLTQIALGAGAVDAITVYPIDRAQILAGSRFDFKVEFDSIVESADTKVTINGADVSTVLGRSVSFVKQEAGVSASALLLRDVVLMRPGRYTVVAGDGKISRTVTWDVYATGARKARNVILFIGDGMSLAHRTAARILAAGITEGKYRGGLAMDTMPNMALVGTA